MTVFEETILIIIKNICGKSNIINTETDEVMKLRNKKGSIKKGNSFENYTQRKSLIDKENTGKRRKIL